MLQRLLDFKLSHGISATIGSLILGVLPEASNGSVLASPEIMPDHQANIVFIFQVAAFTITIIAGTLTTLNAWHKYRDRKRAKKEQTQKTQKI